MRGAELQRGSGARGSHIAVIGGGIAGLCAALTLHEAGTQVTLIEACDRLGGKIRTERADDYIIEAGPDSILSSKPAGLALIERIGLLDQVVNTREDGQGARILHRGKLQPLPEGMTGLVPMNARALLGTELLSWPGKLRLALEYFLPARKDPHDESVGSFVRRRLGGEFYRNIAEPLLAGIYAGDADQLSLRATFPRLRETERRHGGLIRGLRAQRRTAPDAPAASRRWTPFISLQGGLAEIVNGLAERLAGADIRTSTRVTTLHHCEPGYLIDIDTGEQLRADGVVLATPAWVAAGLVRWMAPQLARELSAIPYVSTATISMAVEASAVARLGAGRGFIIPSAEGRTLTAVTIASRKFGGRAPDGHVLLRAYVGRASDQDCLALSDAELIDVVRRELAELTGLSAAPSFTRLHRWPRALPQYNLGHPERLARIETLAGQLPVFALTGAAYRGVGVPDCIHDGITQAEGLVRQLAAPGGYQHRLAAS